MKVVVNSSVLIFLVKLNKIELLKNLFTEVIIPEAVHRECVLEGNKHEESLLIANTTWIQVKQSKNLQLVELLSDLIDDGEAEAITLALETKSLIILDDKDARKIARGLNLKVTGILGILLLAKKKKLIKEISPLIEKLKEEGFRISDELTMKILKEANE